MSPPTRRGKLFTPRRHAEEICNRNGKRFRQFIQHRDGQFFEPALQTAHIGAVYLSIDGQLFLRQTAFAAPRNY